MALNANTISLLNSVGPVLKPARAFELFTTIVNKRIAEATTLIADKADAEPELISLEDADLIAASSNRDKFYVTAKGLKVARALDQLPAGQ